MFQTLKKKFIGDKKFYRRVLYVAIPMIVQNAITSFVSFLDNIMVGQIGTEQMSGVAIVNQLMFVFNIFIFGGASGAGIFGTQFFGKNDHIGHKYTFRFKLYICAVISAAAILLFGFLPDQLISLYLSDSGNIGNIDLALKFGRDYLYIMMFSLVPFALCQAYVTTIRETGHTFIPMVASFAAVVINLILDYIFIFGKFGLPVMGVKGAALATVIARFIECIIVVVWTHFNPEKNKYIKGAYKSPRIPKSICKSILIKGTPLMINEMLWATGMTVIVQCYAARGLEVVASQNIASTITNLFNIVYIQLGICISIIVGQHLGAGELEEARDADNKLMFFCTLCCVGIAVIMGFFGVLFPEIYNTEPEIKNLAKTFIVISAAFMPVYAFCHGAYFTLRSGGKTFVTFLFDSVYTWILVIPSAYFLSKYTSLSIETVFCLVQITEVIKAVIGFFMLKSSVWIQNIVEKD